MAVRIDLRAKSRLEKSKKQFKKDAQARGLLDDFLFITSFNALEDQLRLMDDLLDEIDKKGLMVEVVTQSTIKRVVNPAVAEYNKMATLANKTSTALSSMIEKAAVKKAVQDDGMDDLV